MDFAIFVILLPSTSTLMPLASCSLLPLKIFALIIIVFAAGFFSVAKEVVVAITITTATRHMALAKIRFLLFRTFDFTPYPLSLHFSRSKFLYIIPFFFNYLHGIMFQSV